MLSNLLENSFKQKFTFKNYLSFSKLSIMPPIQNIWRLTIWVVTDFRIFSSYPGQKLSYLYSLSSIMMPCSLHVQIGRNFWMSKKTDKMWNASVKFCQVVDII